MEFVDFSFRKKHGHEIPDAVKDFVDAETINKTCLYEDAKYRLWIPNAVLDLLLDFYLAVSGFYPVVLQNVLSWTENTFVAALLFFVIISIPGAIISIPFALYSEFGIEKHFGFSKMTMGLWITDQIKAILLSLVITSILLGAMIGLFKYATDFWWIFLGIVYVAFSLIISIVYPLFIAPLFNKFTPLEDGELKTRLEALLQKCGFKSSGLFVMDASKRSGHSNAYFTGFGKSKRVVLYDTLMQQLTTDEIEAVLGHELGHYKHHHIIKRMCVMIPLIFVVLFVVNCLVRLPELYNGFGFGTNGIISYKMFFIGIFLTGLVFSGYSRIQGVIANFFSRRDEFQADAFSAKICGSGEPLISALIKLNKENLSEIQVPKIYSAFNYNHPPLLERISAISK